MKTDTVIVKANGDREVFSPDKLMFSLKKAGATEEIAQNIANHISGEIKDGMSTHEIFKHAFYLLHKAERPVALRYSLRRSLMDLGPSGFPFEKFIGEIFRRKGYTVQTGVMVPGQCVMHEVDLVAYNENKLIMGEVKFHNQLGIKSDLKVALYVKARFDDIRSVTHQYDGKERKLDEGWLITNTKFSSSAIQYAECQKLKIIGWNYPGKDSLVRMVEDSNLHPLTCLTTLKTSEKQTLMNKGVVLCNTVAEDPQLLKELGLSDEEIASIQEEAKMLCPIVEIPQMEHAA